MTSLFYRSVILKDTSVLKIVNKFSRTNRTFAYHAEIVAFFRVPPKLRKDVILYVTRTSPDGTTRLSKPCQNCQRMLKRWKTKIYYTTDTDFKIDMIKCNE